MVRPWTLPATVALVAAALVSLALLVLALVAPVYSSESQAATAEGADPAPVEHSTATLVQMNGFGALVLAAIPLVVTLLVALLIRRGSSTAEYVAACVVTLLYGGLCVLALLSIGIFLAPVALCLVVACATARIPEVPRVAAA